MCAWRGAPPLRVLRAGLASARAACVRQRLRGCALAKYAAGCHPAITGMNQRQFCFVSMLKRDLSELDCDLFGQNHGRRIIFIFVFCLLKSSNIEGLIGGFEQQKADIPDSRETNHTLR
ncbi:hypothetical protein NPIL_385261 [Nephila pilipes]|uniref:Uncharacterized protein n=1 Tax=Nephila pilipes TaxID=299642 RepID=A0A8X6QC76_NEPPI|nr:hypothetical protein NPIL_385261 [Nephila pilipes]